MKNKFLLKALSTILVLSGLMLSGCTTIPTDDISVEAESAPGVSLSSYNTYAWLATLSVLDDTYGQWKPPGFDADLEIQRLITQELDAKGFIREDDLPDLFVIFLAGVDMDALEGELDSKLKSITITNIPRGALIIGLLDSKTEELVWAGVAEAEIQQDISAEVIKKRLDFAVTQIFKKLSK